MKPLKIIKQELMQVIKRKENVEVEVKIYEYDDHYYDENDNQVPVEMLDVEIFVKANGDYLEAFVTNTYQDKERDQKEANKRSKAVLKTVKKWFEHKDILVSDEIEQYHC